MATKLPVWIVESRADMERILDDQLTRMQTSRIDCYLLHALNAKMWPKMRDLGAADFLDAAKADGRIGYAGFSYHDEASAFAPIIDDYAWDFCQIQYNYMDGNTQAGSAGLAYAASKGMAVIVMEPVKGGLLATAPPPIQALWDTAETRRSPVEWALSYVLDDARTSLLLSGMSTMEQVVENVRICSEAGPGSLTAADIGLIDQVRQAYLSRTVVDCTGCRYCQPCPQGIAIPMIFSVGERGGPLRGSGPLAHRLPDRPGAGSHRAVHGVHGVRHLRGALPAATEDPRGIGEGGGDPRPAACREMRPRHQGPMHPGGGRRQ